MCLSSVRPSIWFQLEYSKISLLEKSKIIPFNKHSYKIRLEEAGERVLFTLSSIFIFVQSWLTVPQVFNDSGHTEHSFSSPNSALFSHACGWCRTSIGDLYLLLEFTTSIQNGTAEEPPFAVTCWWLCGPCCRGCDGHW